MPTPSLLIRRARRADVPTIVHLLADDELGRQRECDTDPLPQTYYSAFDALDSDPRHELIVAELDGEIVGTLHLTFLPSLSFQGRSRAQIESVRMTERLRGQGWGGQLMHWAIDRAREAGCHVVQLTTHNARPDAHRFYERLGFVASHVGMKLKLDTH